MTTIGVTGHSNLSDATAVAVAEVVRTRLSAYVGEELVGITCLARGADQIFAEAVLDLGGTIDVVIPAADYITGIRDAGDRARFERLTAQARAIHELPYATSGPDSYFAASKFLIDRSEHIVAVWDGSPADGRGGTSDAVDYARRQGREVLVIWPSGAQRVS